MKNNEDAAAKQFGMIVRKRRESLGWTQEALAAEALSNMNRKGYISQIENGRIPNITRHTVNNVVRALQLDPGVIPHTLRWPTTDSPPLNEPAEQVVLGKHPYDLVSELGSNAADILEIGMKVLYEEHALFPELDEEAYKQNRSLRIPDEPFYKSPRGFVKLHPRDFEWLDPRDRNRRIIDGTIEEVLGDGRVMFSKEFGQPCPFYNVVDVLPADLNF